MAIDGKILKRAKDVLNEKRRQHEELLSFRTQKVYAIAPRVRELDIKLKETMSEVVGIALGVDEGSNVDDIREKNLALQKERYEEIKHVGFPEKYLDDDYICASCHDTGYIGTKMCKCLEKIYKEEQSASLSSLFKLGNETFENFKLEYYDDKPVSGTSIAPRESMEVVYEICVEYARKFGNQSMNLFFNGAPGLGKTYLSACIARVVADSGHSVVYDMATSIFNKFEEVKFTRASDSDDIRLDVQQAREEIKRYLECDLLIIDDIGTELTTAFTISALYEIINTRLITGKKTLINSNLTINELRRRYSEQIMSRLEGEYQVLTFYGDDIRKKRNAV
ncbi:MAG: ATP-binding protein [Oscillospiraceae bacterium]|nr:ATP-binding protein [Oscillospiraceae bacterium]